MRLRGVLEQEQAVTIRKLTQGAWLAELPVEVHRQQCGRALGDQLPGVLDVDQSIGLPDVAEPGRGTRMQHGQGRRDEGMGGDDDLVSLADARRDQRKRQGSGAGSDPHAVLDPTVGRELPLEAVDLFTEDEAAARHHPLERLGELGPEIVVLLRKIAEWHWIVSRQACDHADLPPVWGSCQAAALPVYALVAGPFRGSLAPMASGHQVRGYPLSRVQHVLWRAFTASTHPRPALPD